MRTTTTILAVAVAVMLLAGAAQAAITIDTVAVGNAGNAADTTGSGSGYGSVSYTYNIGKYEVTAGQYTAFLNAKANVSDTYGLYNGSMWSSAYGCKIQQTSISGGYSYSVAADYANRPVNYVSYWDSLRFTNWLGNGQGASSTETGAYTLNGYNGPLGGDIHRNAGWTYAVTSTDEWYKAAYYTGSGYSLYANGTSTAPVGGTASNYNWAIGSTWDGTVNGDSEQNSTKDMMGNVSEWNEENIVYIAGYDYRGVRGGSFGGDSLDLQSSYSHYSQVPNSDGEAYGLGFRVSQVPEPATMAAFALGGLTMLRRRRK